MNTSQQTYIALGFGMLAAAHLKVDATPLEGFDNIAFDEFLSLPAQGLKSTVLLALGYRDEENDWLLNLKKVRRSNDELFIELS